MDKEPHLYLGKADVLRIRVTLDCWVGEWASDGIFCPWFVVQVSVLYSRRNTMRKNGKQVRYKLPIDLPLHEVNLPYPFLVLHQFSAHQKKHYFWTWTSSALLLFIHMRHMHLANSRSSYPHRWILTFISKESYWTRSLSDTTALLRFWDGPPTKNIQ